MTIEEWLLASLVNKRIEYRADTLVIESASIRLRNLYSPVTDELVGTVAVLVLKGRSVKDYKPFELDFDLDEPISFKVLPN